MSKFNIGRQPGWQTKNGTHQAKDGRFVVEKKDGKWEMKDHLTLCSSRHDTLQECYEHSIELREQFPPVGAENARIGMYGRLMGHGLTQIMRVNKDGTCLCLILEGRDKGRYVTADPGSEIFAGK